MKGCRKEQLKFIGGWNAFPTNIWGLRKKTRRSRFPGGLGGCIEKRYQGKNSLSPLNKQSFFQERKKLLGYKPLKLFMLPLNTSNLVEVMEDECMHDENEYILNGWEEGSLAHFLKDASQAKLFCQGHTSSENELNCSFWFPSFFCLSHKAYVNFCQEEALKWMMLSNPCQCESYKILWTLCLLAEEC